MPGPRSRSRLVALLVVLVSLVLAAAPVGAQGGLWGMMFPEATRTGPPDWVRPGTRIVQYVASASVPQSRYALVEDPDGPYENPRTGKRYRRTDESGEGMEGPAGDGYSVIDIVSVSPEQVVGAVSLYSIDRSTNTLSYLPIGGGPEPAGAMDAVWLHPDIVADLVTSRDAPGWEVLVGPYPVGGVTYEVAALVSSSQDISIDRRTGLVVVSTGNSPGIESPVRIQGEDPPRSNSMLTYQQLLGTRDRTMGGIGAPAPGWLRPGLELVYQGTYEMGGAQLPAGTTLRVLAVGDDWAQMSAATRVGDGPLASVAETGVVSGGAGPFWYDPGALAGLRAGDVLDRDPILGTTTRVDSVGSWAGRATVWIVTEGPGMASWFQYDVTTGVVLGYSLAQGVGTTTVWLTAMP